MNEPPSRQQALTMLRRMDLHPDSMAFAEDLFERYLTNPDSVPPNWADYFGALDRDPGPTPRRRVTDRENIEIRDLQLERLQVRVLQYINSFRFLGHFAAQVDPLGCMAPELPPELTLAYHRLDDVNPEQTFDPGSLHGPSPARLDEIESILKDTYCASIGAEFMHLVSTAEKRWLQQRLESARGHFGFDDTTREAILERLTAAEGLERYLHNRYVGQKRFSLEGAESLIPLLNALVQRGGARGVSEIVVGMAHRGRLNVQVNVFGKSPRELADEFEGRHSRNRGTGDVKYHLGIFGRYPDPGRGSPPRAGVQSLASRNRHAGGRGIGAGPAGAAARQDGPEGDAGGDPR
jgi:2-oxoglutarate dehydrogenase E1 component